MTRILGLNLTELWMLAVVGVLSGALELVALLRPEWMPVISRTMRDNGCRWILWPVILGGLPGHFWSPRWLYFPALRPLQPYVLPATLLVALAYDLLGPKVSNETAFLIALVSLFYCAVVWSQCR